MGTIIAIIALSTIAAAAIGYYLTREEVIQEESPLQKVLNKSLERSAKDIKVKDAVEVKPRVTKTSASPELVQLIDTHGKDLAKIQDEIVAEFLAQEVKQPTPPAKKRSRHSYKK